MHAFAKRDVSSRKAIAFESADRFYVFWEWFWKEISLFKITKN